MSGGICKKLNEGTNFNCAVYNAHQERQTTDARIEAVYVSEDQWEGRRPQAENCV